MTFDDLRSAGRELATALEGRKGDSPIVLGLARGGVPLAVEVAVALSAPLDVVVFRSFFLRPAGDRVRAAYVGGTLAVDDELQPGALTANPVEAAFVADGLSALAERNALVRGERPVCPVAGRTVMLVDNAMRTGGTMRSGVRLVRKLGPARVVVAVAAAGKDALEATEPFADEVVCLATVPRLGNAAMAYRRFDVPDDLDIASLLAGADERKGLRAGGGVARSSS